MPVTICFGRRPSNRVILKTQISHRIRVEQIPSVEHDRRMHPPIYLSQVNSSKIGPLSGKNQSLRISDCVQSRVGQMNAGTQIELLYSLVSLRIVRGHVSPLPDEIVNQIHSHGT